MEIIQPAQLAFLAIYNPSLGRTDETLHDQVVYYYSAPVGKAPKQGQSAAEAERAEREERNERLRQIGLAQGMVEFAKAFSEGQPVESIDAEKSRIVLHQLEPGWWILASVDLTRLRNAPSHSRSKSEEPAEEYSAREVAPQELLLQQVLRAHSVFLLHHAASLADLYVHLSRDKFCGVLEIFWNRFVATWDVLLHGNPAVDIFDGVKLAAGGELGVGVGEEEWGSGEREVLEGFIGRTEGLVDLMVSRFGEEEGPQKSPWLGKGASPSVNDGVVFSGIGAITKLSARGLSAWLESVYMDGVAGYGVVENPHSMRRRRRKKQASQSSRGHDRKVSEQRGRASRSQVASPTSPPGIPPPIVRAADEALAAATSKAEQGDQHESQRTEQQPLDSQQSTSEQSTTDIWVKYMTLGVYGSSWGIPAGRPRSHSREEASEGEQQTSSEQKSGQAEATSFSTATSSTRTRPLRHIIPRSIEGSDPNAEYDMEHGCFLIGLRGDLSSEPRDEPEPSDAEPASPSAREEGEEDSWERRIVVRTLHLQLPLPSKSSPPTVPTTTADSATYFDRFRVVLYVRRPFVFAFLFSTSTPTLSYTELYRSLHQQLAPLHKPLLRSTSPLQAQARTSELRTPRTVAGPSGEGGEMPVWDVVYDPTNLSLVASLPNIPEPILTAAMKGKGLRGRVASPSPSRPPVDEWSRLEALHVHSQVLATVAGTRHRVWERERVMKTGRGWWIVWLRVLSEGSAGETAGEEESTREEGAAEETSREEAPAESAPTKGAESPPLAVDPGKRPTRCEAILVRHSPDTPTTLPASSSTRKPGGGMGWGSVASVFTGGSPLTSPARGGPASSAGGGREGDGVGRMVEGVGLDARRYVEGLLKARR